VQENNFGPVKAPKRAPPKKKPAPKKKKPSAKGDYIKAGIERNLAGKRFSFFLILNLISAEARAKEAELERVQKKKAQVSVF
jgi:hypothetical protein